MTVPVNPEEMPVKVRTKLAALIERSIRGKPPLTDGEHVYMLRAHDKWPAAHAEVHREVRHRVVGELNPYLDLDGKFD